MAKSRAVIFDYIGTLVNCKSYTMEASRLKLYNSLIDEGFKIEKDQFLEAYIKAHEKYRVVRFEQLREVTNAIWVADALNEIGFNVSPDDIRIRSALNVFFKDYVDSLSLREGALKLIKKVSEECKVGLLSNFTYAPVVYCSLRNFNLSRFFNAIVVSEQNGWRKPSKNIFKDTLDKLGVEASETVFIGDNPLEDVKGALDCGLKTVFVASQFYSIGDLSRSHMNPHFSVLDLERVYEKFVEIIG